MCISQLTQSKKYFQYYYNENNVLVQGFEPTCYKAPLFCTKKFTAPLYRHSALLIPRFYSTTARYRLAIAMFTLLHNIVDNHNNNVCVPS